MATPRGGGLAVTGAVMIAWAAVWLTGETAGRPWSAVIAVLPGALLLAIVSWIDDLRGLSPASRLSAQTLAVAAGLAALRRTGLPVLTWLDWSDVPGWLSVGSVVAAGLLWVWWVNLFNFMDGIDGLAGSEAAAIGVGLTLFAAVGNGLDPGLALLAAPIAGAALGFLVWNWSPARIFLGDVGSTTIGYLTGFLLLGLVAAGHWKIALILPLYFLVDATATLGRRLLRGERVWEAHRQHFYQRAVAHGLGHAAVVRRVIAADLLLIVCGWMAENSGWGALWLGAAAAIVATLLGALARGR